MLYLKMDFAVMRIGTDSDSPIDCVVAVEELYLERIKKEVTTSRDLIYVTMGRNTSESETG